MTFLAPAFLWLALLLIIPLILYLLPLPRRRLQTAALYLWERFLEKEPFGRASEKMRRAIGLALLAAVFLCLILAAAELAVGSTSITAKKVILLVDTSAPMTARSPDNLTNLAHARRAATNLLNSLPPGAQVAILDSGTSLNTVYPFGRPGRDAIERLDKITADHPDAIPEARSHLAQHLASAYDLWGTDPATEIYVFTNHPLPPTQWANRAHLQLAPVAGDNVAITDLDVHRHGREIIARFTLANFSAKPRSLSGTLQVTTANPAEVRGSFSNVPLAPGQSTIQTIRFEEPAEARVALHIENAGDILPADDWAHAHVPALDQLSANIHWPTSDTAAAKPDARHDVRIKNEYVASVLTALQQQGALGPLNDNPSTAAPVSIYVNALPDSWPKSGNLIILYPLKSGIIPLKGVRRETLTITRQADDPLLADVDLRGLTVKDAVLADIPDWAHPLVWAQDTPLVWSGQHDQTKILFVGIPILPSGSRLPLVASFPVLLRNTLQWMLPPTQVHGLLSAADSDLRQPADAAPPQTFAARRSLATPLVLLAVLLAAVEWGLFHRRLTE
jgi:hypothetical protein